MSRILFFDPTNPNRHAVASAIIEHLKRATARVVVEIRDPRRTNPQNDRMWAMLTDISNQVEWDIDGVKQKLTPEEWKEIITAGLAGETRRVARGMDGGFVILGTRTSRMSIKRHGELMDLIDAFGTQQGVVWTAPREVEHAY